MCPELRRFAEIVRNRGNRMNVLRTRTPFAEDTDSHTIVNRNVVYHPDVLRFIVQAIHDKIARYGFALCDPAVVIFRKDAPDVGDIGSRSA